MAKRAREKRKGFRYNAEARLRRYLGEYDAYVELNELAIRFFEDQARSSNDARSFVERLSTAYGVRVNAASLSSLRNNAAKTHITVVYRSAEQFFSEYKREHQHLHKRVWPQAQDKTSPLARLLTAVGTSYGDGQRAIGKAEEEIFEYYRHARNLITHRESDEDVDVDDAAAGKRREELDGRHKTLHEKHDQYIYENYGFGTLPADGTGTAVSLVPHRYEDLDFDDFILFSRNLKVIAEKLSCLGRPTDVGLLMAIEKSSERFLKHDGRNLTRVRNRVTGKLRTRFGLDDAEARRIASLWEPLASLA